MDGLQSDDEDDDADGSDKEMGVDAEDGDEANNAKLQKLAAQVCFTPLNFQNKWINVIVFSSFEDLFIQ